MSSNPLPYRLVACAALAGTLFVAGCAEEAGSKIFTSEFGNATMNNHLVQTCQAGPDSAQGKYVSKVGGCAPRTLDGEYARVTYDGYIADAVEVPPVTRSFE